MKKRILIPLLAVLALFCACKGRGNASADYEVVNNGSSAAADSVRADSLMLSKPKLVKTAGIQLKVKNVQQTAEQITALATSIKGIVMHHRMGSTAERSQNVRISNDSVMRITSFSTTAEMTLKIPSVKLEEFMNQVARMGIYVNDRTMNITDKSLDYLSAQLKLKSRTELVSQQKSGKVIIKKPEDVLYLKDDMIDQQIGNRQIDDAVKNSIVTLSFYQSNTINKEIIANDDPSAYDLPFFKRLGIALAGGCGLFVNVIMALAHIWVFILATIAVWMIVRYYKGRRAVGMVKS